MLYLTCTTITSVDLAHYGVSRAKEWVSVDCGTSRFKYVAKSRFSLHILVPSTRTLLSLICNFYSNKNKSLLMFHISLQIRPDYLGTFKIIRKAFIIKFDK